MEGVIYSEGDLPFGSSLKDYPSQYSSLLGECTANTCGAGESLFDVSINLAQPRMTLPMRVVWHTSTTRTSQSNQARSQ